MSRIVMIMLSVLIIAASPASGQEQAPAGMIAGTVLDKETGSPIPGAVIKVLDTASGDIADSEGRYSIESVPVGLYNIRFSIIGYETLVRTNITVSPNRTTELSVQLALDPVNVGSVTVTARESYFEKDPEAEVSGRTIDSQEIMNSTGGLMDIQRVVQVLPSVVSGSDQLNEIIVRGGNYGENLFVMDGIEIPNPNHFAIQGAGGGPISLLRAEFIDNVSFLAGAFPARYGDKASSVMDISLRRGNREQLLTTFDLSMAGAGFMSEGPVGETGTFLLSGRKSYLDLISSDYGITAVPRYYNLQGKLTFNLGNHTLLWNSVYGNDAIDIEPGEEEDNDDDFVNQHTNLAVSGITLKSALSRNVFSEAVVSVVRNNWSTDVWEEGKTRSEPLYNNQSVESEVTLKYDLTWLLGGQELSGGVSLKNSRFDHDIFADQDTVFTWDTGFYHAEQDTITGIYRLYPAWRDNKRVSTIKSAAYGQIRLNPTERLSVRLGGRYDRTEYNDDQHVSPRIGLRYQLRDNIWLSGAYGVHYQSPAYLFLTANEKNKNLKDYHTDQTVLGAEWQPRPDTRVTLETYYKRYEDVPVDRSWLTLDPWDSSEGEMVNGATGHSEGIELYVHRKMSTSFMYILSYSYYRAWFKDPRVNEYRPWDFDHRNLFTVTAAKRWRLIDAGWYQDMKSKWWYKATSWLLPFGDEVMFSTKWRFAGGRPYTEPSYLRDYHVWIIPEDTPFNTARHSDYHRLDLRLDLRHYFKGWSLVTYFEIMNAYGRDNIWDYSRDEFGTVEKVNQFSTFPVGGFIIEF